MQGLTLARVSSIDLGLDLSPVEVHTARTLCLGGPMTMSALAEALGLPLSTTTHRVDKLVKKKLASRGRSKTDRRIVEVSRTASGLRLNQQFQEVHLATSKALLPLTAAERR